MESKEAFLGQLKEALDELQAEMEKLEVKAREEGAHMKQKYKKEIDALQLQIKEARKKFGALKTSSGPAWKEFKAGAKKAFEEIKKSWKSASHPER